MPKYDIGELVAALNEAVNKLDNLRTKYKDSEKENARLREALRGAEAWIDRWTHHVGRCSGKDESCECGRAFVLHTARAALGEKE